jgi:diguanylate cyclase (GGDEF)-like protein
VRRCGQLTSAGWQVTHASDVAEALAKVRTGQVDVAVLHVSCDEVEAMDLPGVLRLAAEMPHLPVLVLAVDPAEAIRCRFLDGGADEILSDRTSAAELSARLRALLRLKLLHDELAASREALSASLARERALLDQFRRDNAHLMTLCTTDPLTHLQNIRHFDLFLEKEFNITRRYGHRLSLMTLDIDHFKLVNDTYGHPSGDFVLKEFSVILKATVRDSDVVARTGGEEFSILLPNAGRPQTRRLAQRILKAVSGHVFRTFGREIRITTSIGSCSYPEDAEVPDAQMLLYAADQALLVGKQRGRNRLVGFHELDATTRRRLRDQYEQNRPAGPEPDHDELLLHDVTEGTRA